MPNALHKVYTPHVLADQENLETGEIWKGFGDQMRLVHGFPYQKVKIIMQATGIMKPDKNLQNTSQKRAMSLGKGNVHEFVYGKN